MNENEHPPKKKLYIIKPTRRMGAKKIKSFSPQSGILTIYSKLKSCWGGSWVLQQLGAPPLCSFLGRKRRKRWAREGGSYMGGSLQRTISSSLR